MPQDTSGQHVPDAKERFLVLKRAGFLDDEAYTLAYAPETVNAWNSQPWQDAISDRKEWTDMLLARGWTRDKIHDTILDYYTTTDKASPFDFIREAYGKGRGKGRI